jgi:hypothetical protein
MELLLDTPSLGRAAASAPARVMLVVGLAVGAIGTG